MWRDHPYCQIDMTIEKTLWMGVGVEWKVGMGGVWTKFEKGVQGQAIQGGGLHKITGLALSANYVKRP